MTPNSMPWHDVKAVLDNRCVVCHGCYDAPCPLQLGSSAGVARGANKESIYATRLSRAQPTEAAWPRVLGMEGLPHSLRVWAPK